MCQISRVGSRMLTSVCSMPFALSCLVGSQALSTAWSDLYTAVALSVCDPPKKCNTQLTTVQLSTMDTLIKLVATLNCCTQQLSKEDKLLSFWYPNFFYPNEIDPNLINISPSQNFCVQPLLKNQFFSFGYLIISHQNPINLDSHGSTVPPRYAQIGKQASRL